NVPDMPFVIANTGIGGTETGMGGVVTRIQTYLVPAQAAAAENPDFEGSVALADTRAFWRNGSESPGTQKYHWNQNAESYFLIGDEMGNQMMTLLE
ncbi:MAG: sialate O-acetylesterase, partial [Desulfobacteraceae bacterium]|nr:sialate O-acetylesterase [Desulfobacteraceae bacterium]